MKKACLSRPPSCLSTQNTVLSHRFPSHSSNRVHLTLKSRCLAPEQGHWLSRGDTPSGSSAQPPSRVAGGVAETHRAVAASGPRAG